MANDLKYVASLFGADDPFSCYIVDELVLLTTDRLCDLTAFCIPYIVRRAGIEKLYYNLGILVCDGCETVQCCLTQNVQAKRFFSLPMTTPVQNFPDMLIRNSQASSWMRNQMWEKIDKYCLPRNEAVEMLSSDDPFVMRLRDANANRLEALVSNLRRA